MKTKHTSKQYDSMGFYNVWLVSGTGGSIEIGNQTNGFDAMNYAEAHFNLGEIQQAEFIYGIIGGCCGEIVKRGAK